MQPKIYPSETHQIDAKLIDPDALIVLKKLREAGFLSFLVGGSVRDLLIGKEPKDFDISTSARPEQIKSVFGRQCILIGRRFRLAHIRFGHKIIEVSTFRRGENEEDLIIHDNEWGTPEEDGLRRDFTSNGLYYDSSNHSIIDYVGGLEDVKSYTLKTIGIPEARFKQDPVRMIRLLKFQARYGFHVDPLANEALATCMKEILKSSSARILEELFRMLESGSAAPFFKLMAEKGMLSILLPKLMRAFRTNEGKKAFHYLSCADQIRQHGAKKPLDRSLICCCLIFPLLEFDLNQRYTKKNMVPHIGDITLAAQKIIKDIFIVSFSHFPRRMISSMIHILIDQYRLTPLTNKRPSREKLFKHKNFGMALQFLKIRALVDQNLVETYTSLKQQFRQSEHASEKKHHPAPHEKVKRHYRKSGHVKSTE